MSQNIRLGPAHYFFMKTPNKGKIQQILSNYSSDIKFKDFMKLCKYYTKEPFSFLVHDKTQIIHYNFGRTYYKMTVSKKMKIIDNKIKHNKVQYDLDRQNAKISALSSGDVSKCEFLTWKHVLPEKDFLEKAASNKRFEYSSLGSEIKNSVAEKSYKILDRVFELNKKEED